jgi:alkylation response protein AidB-like acyl-CoA dehydrogenase
MLFCSHLDDKGALVPIAITDDHRALGDSVRRLMNQRDVRAAARGLLEAEVEEPPAVWADLVGLGLPGLHVPEEHGGADGGVPDLVVVVEELGAAVLPGAFVPTAIASAVLVTAGDQHTRGTLLPGLAEGRCTAAIALDADVAVADGTVSGTVPAALSAGVADLLLLPAGDDVVVVDLGRDGVVVEIPRNLDPTRRSARVTLSGAPAVVLPGARAALRDSARVVLAAEAVGVARQCTHLAAEYAKVRKQFGRTIATFQAVKHHCANMLVAAELATAAVWDAARAAEADDDEQRALTAAVAASLAGRAAYDCANLCIQVHGGIGITWEHDAHLYLRRATALRTLLAPDTAAADATDLYRRGVRPARTVELPPEAESLRGEVSGFLSRVGGLDADAQRNAMVEAGYAMPHWPRPWGRGAGAIEQLVIEQEFTDAGLKRPSYGITAWILLTLVQHGTEEQVQRWVPPALRQDVIWCQLFSEPEAGSDAAAVRTRATRVEGGWLLNGQKIWTSDAHEARMGLATVRTDPDAPKHQGITTLAVDMSAQGVEVRPLRQTTGDAEFNEVFFDDVFVPDADVVGPVNAGWTVARATLGNESVSIGDGTGAMVLPVHHLIAAYDTHPGRLAGGAERLGRYVATQHAASALNLRSAHRAVAGTAPGPEGNVTKLVLSELMHEAAEVLVDLGGPSSVYAEGAGAWTAPTVLMSRAMSIYGGTSEIKRNQIAERILGMPRDPLVNN